MFEVTPEHIHDSPPPDNYLEEYDRAKVHAYSEEYTASIQFFIVNRLKSAYIETMHNNKELVAYRACVYLSKLNHMDTQDTAYQILQDALSIQHEGAGVSAPAKLERAIGRVYDSTILHRGLFAAGTTTSTMADKKFRTSLVHFFTALVEIPNKKPINASNLIHESGQLFKALIQSHMLKFILLDQTLVPFVRRLCWKYTGIGEQIDKLRFYQEHELALQLHSL